MSKRDNGQGKLQKKSAKTQRHERKMSDNNHIKELEASIQHRFVNLTPLLSQKAVGKHLIVENVFLTPSYMIVRCQYNFKAFDNPLTQNKFIKGVNKFKGADKVVWKISYLQHQRANADKVFTVCYEDMGIGLVETPINVFIEAGQSQNQLAVHRIKLFKCDGEIIWDRKNKFSLI